MSIFIELRNAAGQISRISRKHFLLHRDELEAKGWFDPADEPDDSKESKRSAKKKSDEIGELDG